MAMSPSPQLSPVMGGAHRIDRHHSNSPPAQAPSKRDKKRAQLSDRLAEITSQFSANRDIHYREQLQALQIDSNLIMEADAHGKEPLPSLPFEVDELVMRNIQKTMMKSIGPIAPPRAGKVYIDFAKEINDAMEERDAALATHERDFRVKLAELNAEHTYRLKLANEEHKMLSKTLRDRLINSVTNKKNRLSRDKETMEIGESNALLLHPSQFGIANPSSPGGIHGKRATRHRREADDLPSLSRKRKAADSDESPAPSRQRMDNGSSTPLWFAEKAALTATQVDSPLYSIEKLFTDRELSLTYNEAAKNAYAHMQRHPAPSTANSSTQASSPEHNSLDAEGNDDEEGGVGMERQYSHATRSTRAPDYRTGLGIDVLGDLNIPGNFQMLMSQKPKLPSILAISTQKVLGKGEASNAPAPLAPHEADAEIELIRRARAHNDREGRGNNLEVENGGKELLQVVAKPREGEWWFVRSEDRHKLEVDEDVDELAMGGVPMSRQGTDGGATSSRGRRIKPVEGRA